jgi:predicted ribosomally synthesized peptide with nif11-like leader
MTRAEEFVKMVESDSDLKAKLSGATTSEEAKKVVSDAGFGDVHSADVKALSQSDELSDSELATASGAGFGIGGSWGGIGGGFNISW